LGGFRAEEMTLLEKRDCDPRGQKPVWTLRGDVFTYKNDCRLPMVPELASELLAHWESIGGETDKLFPVLPTNRTFDKDLKRAQIEKTTHQGNASFHSLRKFFVTEMSKRHSLAKVQELARHADVQTTANVYTQIRCDDLSEVWDMGKIL